LGEQIKYTPNVEIKKLRTCYWLTHLCNTYWLLLYIYMT